MTPRLRCAIYTRKSTEEGLEQEFNSLHAQREACEAYVLSQAGEGWTALKEVYDDGGFSGGSMERPALQRLLADIDAGKIDVVVVYKVDRITRSLSDFARIVEVFDRRGVSFVSVTQAFNTTSSMGRLTLNVLLSFAQFEREVTGERIRDKIAASKAKGMWMGGMPPLGYDAVDRKLVINPAEAESVRLIFSLYLDLGSARLVADELEARGVRSKSWTTRKGRAVGGVALSRGAVFHILQSEVYRGKIAHKGQTHDGQHEAIISQDIFDAAKARLAEQVSGFKDRPVKATPGPLAKKLFDADGEPMSPSFSYGRGGRLYRYYIAMALQVGRRPSPGAIERVSAPAIESFLVSEIRRLSGSPDITVASLADLVERVEIGSSGTQVVLNVESAFPSQHPEFALKAVQRTLADEEHAVLEGGQSRLRILLPRRLKLRGGKASISLTQGVGAERRSDGLRQALRRAHRDLADLNASPLQSPEILAGATAPATMYERQLARLAMLSPDIQGRIMTGDHAPELSLKQILDAKIPLAWDDQARWFEAYHAR
jgi:DNA invertase Pin-like site-specific DNA recombinase